MALRSESSGTEKVQSDSNGFPGLFRCWTPNPWLASAGVWLSHISFPSIASARACFRGATAERTMKARLRASFWFPCFFFFLFFECFPPSPSRSAKSLDAMPSPEPPDPPASAPAGAFVLFLFVPPSPPAPAAPPPPGRRWSA